MKNNKENIEYENYKALDFFQNLLNSNNNISQKEEKNNVGNETEVKLVLSHKLENGLIKEKQDSSEKEKNKLENILNKKGKVIFDGEIEDIRLDNKFFKENGVSMIRIRHLKGKEFNKETGNLEEVDKYLLTVKSRGNSKFSETEYEKEYSEVEIEKIINDYGLSPSKIYKKYRKEYSTNLSNLEEKNNNLEKNEKEIKISLDKYKNYSGEEKEENKKKYNISDEEVFKNYGHIPYFAEIETAETKEYLAEAIELLGLKDTFQTTVGPRELDLLFKFLEKVTTEDDIERFKDLISAIVASVYSTNNELDKNLSNKFLEKYQEVSLSTKHFTKLFTVLIRKSLRKIIIEKPNFIDIFSDLVEIEKNENNEDKIKFKKRFYNKVERYIGAYEIAIFNSIKKDLFDKIKKGEEINDKEIYNIFVENKIQAFNQILFIFGNNLNREQLEEILNKPKSEVVDEFDNLEKKLNKILKNDKYKNIENFSLLKMIRFLSSELFFENKKEEKKFFEVIEEHIYDNFEMLSKDFSTWLNSPKNKNSDKDEYINNLKNIWNDLFESVSILKDLGYAFEDLSLDKNQIIEDILGNNKFKKIIFNDNNFSLSEVEGGIKLEKSLLKNFLLSLKDDNTKVIAEIREKYLEFNEQRILNILDNELYYGEEKITLEDFREIVKDEENFKLENINYKLWKTIPQSLKLEIYIKYILKNKKEFDEIYGEIINFSKQNKKDKKIENKINSFIKIEYIKRFQPENEKGKKIKINDFSIEDSSFVNYKNKTLEQIEKASKIFTDEKIENLAELFETNKNDSDLLVAWLRFNFKYKQADEENKNVEDLHISSDIFIEQTIINLGENKDLEVIEENGVKKIKNNIGAEIIIGTTDSHNTSGWNADYMKKRWKRGIEKGVINTNESFYLENNGEKTFFKDIEELYMPSKDYLEKFNFINRNLNVDNSDFYTKDSYSNVEEKAEGYYEGIKAYIKEGFEFCEAVDGKKYIDENTDFYKNLKKINFPISDTTMVSKLKKFLKFSIDVLHSSKDMVIDSYKDKDFLDNKIDTEEFREALDLKEGELKIGPVKELDRTTVKNNGKYAGSTSKIGDLTRMMITKGSLEELTKTSAKFIEYAGKLPEVKQIWMEDAIGNLFEKAPKKASGYRDAKMMLVLESGNTVEVQFHLEEYAKVKTQGVELDEKLEERINNELSFIEDKEIELEKNNYIQKKLNIFKNKIKKVLGVKETKTDNFSENEKNKILDIIEKKKLVFPENFYKNILKIENNEKYKNNISKSDYIADDALFNIGRILKEILFFKITNKKIETIQKCLYDIAGGKTAKKEAEKYC